MSSSVCSGVNCPPLLQDVKDSSQSNLENGMVEALMCCCGMSFTEIAFSQQDRSEEPQAETAVVHSSSRGVLQEGPAGQDLGVLKLAFQVYLENCQKIPGLVVSGLLPEKLMPVSALR